MNIVVILANGVGARFGSNVPKQFHRINGKMIIEYVIESILAANTVDGIVVVTNLEENKNYLSELSQYRNISFVEGGVTRNFSLFNALSFIKKNYDCNKLIVCDAVRPMITGELIDKYFSYLDDYAAVVTAQKITDSLGCYDMHKVFRDRYYLMQSPEGFDFELLYECFDPESKLTEVTQQLPADSKIKLYFDFNDNYKLTYPADLKYIEALISARDNSIEYKTILDNVNRLNRFLFENYPSQTKSWTVSLQKAIPNLLHKWQITDYQVVKTSHFGIVFLASSIKYGECAIKIIPPFIERYETEKCCYQYLSSTFMCELYDYDDGCPAILLCRMEDRFESLNTNNQNLFEFFRNVIESYNNTDISEEEKAKFNDYSLILKNKTFDTGFTYRYDEIMSLVRKANQVYNDIFKDDKKYLVHGDLHRFNIMKTNDEMVAIDPIGYVAPLELDIARFIGTELTQAKSNVLELKNCLVDYFSPISSKERIEAMLFVDMVFRLHNSIYENESFELTDKWLKLLS